MIEPQSVQAGESAVSNTTGAWPTASRSARSFASTPLRHDLQPIQQPIRLPRRRRLPRRHIRLGIHWCLERNRDPQVSATA